MTKLNDSYAKPSHYPSNPPRAAWLWSGRLYPWVSYPSGTKTDDGLILDMQTGELKEVDKDKKTSILTI